MSNPLVVVRDELAPDGSERIVARGLWLWCPGCWESHRPRTAAADGTAEGTIWEWNGATDTTFTISPSLLTWGSDANGETRCHSFIREGHWHFLSDCTHHLAGQTVPMVPVPDWLCR